MANFTDPLSMDISRDLKRVDGVVTRILQDRLIWNDFLRDPNGVLVRLGLHPPTTPEINDRVNRIFYATLTNRRLLELAVKHFEKLRVADEEAARYNAHFAENLRNGIISHPLEYDLTVAFHFLSDEEVLREILSLSINHLNEQHLLERRHDKQEIERYVEAVIGAVRYRQPIAAHAKLETWDRNYGIGHQFGGGLVESSVIATVSGIVEASIVGTAAVLAVAHSYVVVEVETVVNGTVLTLVAAAGGDHESLRAAALFRRLLDFSSELLLHAYTFERGR